METYDALSAGGGMLNTVLTSEFFTRFDAVILANGEYPWHQQPLTVLENAPYIICCDGAADTLLQHGRQPEAIIGDGDSIHAATRSQYQAIFHHRPDQNSNDQSKAVTFALQQGKTAPAIVGACGKRDDHALANIALLMHYLQQGYCIPSFSNYGVFIPARDNTTFISHPGQQISVFNFSARDMQSQGLRYGLYDLQYFYQGALNEALADTFTINACGDYLVFLNY